VAITLGVTASVLRLVQRLVPGPQVNAQLAVCCSLCAGCRNLLLLLGAGQGWAQTAHRNMRLRQGVTQLPRVVQAHRPHRAVVYGTEDKRQQPDIVMFASSTAQAGHTPSSRLQTHVIQNNPSPSKAV